MSVPKTASLKITLERNGIKEDIVPNLVTEVLKRDRYFNPDIPTPAKLFESMSFYSQGDRLICAGLFIPNGVRTILLAKGSKLIIEVI